MTASPPIGHVRPAPRWVTGVVPAASMLEKLSTELRLPPLVCSLLTARGHCEADAAKSFL